MKNGEILNKALIDADVFLDFLIAKNLIQFFEFFIFAVVEITLQYVSSTSIKQSSAGAIKALLFRRTGSGFAAYQTLSC